MQLEYTHKQALALSMQTSMHLLQLNNLQLRNYIGELMTSNAVVELEFPEIDYRPGPFDFANASRRSIRRSDDDSDTSKEELMHDKAESPSALNDLFLQSAAMNLSDYDQTIMTHLIHSLDENGFLPESPDNIARILDITRKDAERCIGLLQGMDPAGVGAANLMECLRLQLMREDPIDSIALQIVESHLAQLAQSRYAAIAKELNCSKAAVIASCDHIRSLSPKPLNGLSSEAITHYIIPDFYVVEECGELRCIMNDYYLPKIKIDPSYREMVHSSALSQDDRDYIQTDLKKATDVIQFLSYRKSTLQRVVEYILTVQTDFFLHGPGHRTPMSNRELAEALSLHESTASRAVNGKFFECKWGVFPLKSLFVRNTGGSSNSVDQILQKIQDYVAAEIPNHALSDQQLADRLQSDGISIARRTVAKYRQSLGIPTAGKRNAQHHL